MSYERRRDLVLLWTGLIGGYFIASPIGWYGMFGWFVAVYPVLSWTTPMRPTYSYLGGIIGLAVVALLSGTDLISVEGLMGILALTIGLVIAKPLQAVVPIKKTVAITFEHVFSRELARARRYERTLAVVVVRSVDDAKSATSELVSLQEVIGGELPVYCDSFVVGNSVVALVPELDPKDSRRLAKRLLESIAGLNLASMGLGIATFPSDGYTSQGMVDAATRNLLEAATFEIHSTDTKVTILETRPPVIADQVRG